MTLRALTSAASRHWEQVLSHVNHAVVFIDRPSSELLHWHGGLGRLLHAGASDVKDFSSFESGGEKDKKAVMIVSSLLDGVTREILQDILQASHFQYVVLVCGQGSAVHSFTRTGQADEDQEFFSQVEDRLLEWMGNINYTAEVFHVPLTTISLGNSVFLTPTHSQLSPLMGSDLHQLELQYNTKHAKHERDFESLKSVDFHSLPQDLQVYYKCFISSVDGLLSDLGVKEDIFSVGYTSAILAAELEAFPPARHRRKMLTERASIVFIDRSLDLASATSYNAESLLDRIQQVLQRLPGHVTDVAINMAPLSNVHKETGSDIIAPGCLAAQSGTQPHLQTLVTGKQKECLMEVNRQLIEAASQCDLPISLTGKPLRVTAEQLNVTLHLFRGKYKEISSHLDWLQVAMATSQTLSHPRMPHCDELISVEKSLLQTLADLDSGEALTQVLQMVERKAGDAWVYSLDDVLCMLVYIYSLTGPSILEQDDVESDIQTAIIDRLIEEKDNLTPLIKSIVGEVVSDRSILSDILDSVFEKLAAVAVAREHLQHFKRIMDEGSAVSPASQNPLLRQLVAAILDTDRGELPDVENKSSGLKDMLKSGFGLFGRASKPRPSDHPLVILYVVGGVTCTEVKQIRDAVSHSKSDIQVLVGSNRLLTPLDAARSVLCDNNLNPGDTSS